MLAPLSWLKDYVDIDVPAKELERLLFSVGFEVEELIELGKDIHIYSTGAHPYLVSDPQKNEIHFTIGDNCSYRVETDIVKKTAKCNFNNPEAAANLIEFFDRIIANADHSREITEEVKNLFVD